MGSSDFTRASRSVWEAMARGWDDRHAYLEEIARPVAERMLERVALRDGETILELAAGTGVVGLAAARAVAPGGRVIVSDFSPAMIEAARRHAAALGLENVEYRVLDAERLDLQTDAVDAVLCRWGYMLMADPGAALAETRRVLRPGGRLSCAVFAGPQQNPWAALPSRVLNQRGHMPAPQSGAPGILALGDRARLEALFAQAGFTSLDVEEVGFTWTFDDADDYWAFVNDAAGALTMFIARLDDEERAVVRAEIADGLEPFRGGGGIAMPAASLVATAS
jgi:ubiquinone/menaquinone biosynthesis C-methylase UbiE